MLLSASILFLLGYLCGSGLIKAWSDLLMEMVRGNKGGQRVFEKIARKSEKRPEEKAEELRPGKLVRPSVEELKKRGEDKRLLDEFNKLKL